MPRRAGCGTKRCASARMTAKAAYLKGVAVVGAKQFAHARYRDLRGAKRHPTRHRHGPNRRQAATSHRLLVPYADDSGEIIARGHLPRNRPPREAPQRTKDRRVRVPKSIEDPICQDPVGIVDHHELTVQRIDPARTVDTAAGVERPGSRLEVHRLGELESDVSEADVRGHVPRDDRRPSPGATGPHELSARVPGHPVHPGELSAPDFASVEAIAEEGRVREAVAVQVCGDRAGRAVPAGGLDAGDTSAEVTREDSLETNGTEDSET